MSVTLGTMTSGIWVNCYPPGKRDEDPEIIAKKAKKLITLQQRIEFIQERRQKVQFPYLAVLCSYRLEIYTRLLATKLLIETGKVDKLEEHFCALSVLGRAFGLSDYSTLLGRIERLRMIAFPENKSKTDSKSSK